MSKRISSTTLSSYESSSSSFATGGSDARARLRRGDATFVNAVAEGRLTQGFKKRFSGSGHIFTGILFALFIAVLLLAILVGTNVYRSLYNDSQATDDLRLSTSLIANTIRVNDTIDSLLRDQGPEGSALVLLERQNGEIYQTRIYKSNGVIVEEYALAGSPYNPERATPIVASDIFEFEYSDGLLSVWTEDGKIDIALRSARRAG